MKTTINDLMKVKLYTTGTWRSPLFYSMIMARDEGGGIGLDNRLPWGNCPTDMAWFKEKTMGKIVIMGYNTWVSIGRKPLPGRYNVIITTKHKDEVNADIKVWADAYYKTEKGQQSPIHSMVVPSPKVAMDALQVTLGQHHRGGEVMVIGGGAIYKQFWDSISLVYLTTFAGNYKSDVSVTLDLSGFDLVYRNAIQIAQPTFEIWKAKQTFDLSYEEKPGQSF